MKQYIYVISVVLLIAFLYILLNPAISFRLFPQKRHTYLSEFLTSALNEKTLNPQKYWEFREFYYPGTFTTTTSPLLNSKITSSLLNRQFDSLRKKYALQPVLYFKSGKIESIDAVTASPIDLTKLPGKSMYLLNNKSLRISDEGSYYFLVAVTSVASMEKANGFFQDDGSFTPPKNYSYLTLSKIMKEK